MKIGSSNVKEHVKLKDDRETGFLVVKRKKKREKERS